MSAAYHDVRRAGFATERLPFERLEPISTRHPSLKKAYVGVHHFSPSFSVCLFLNQSYCLQITFHSIHNPSFRSFYFPFHCIIHFPTHVFSKCDISIKFLSSFLLCSPYVPFLVCILFILYLSYLLQLKNSTSLFLLQFCWFDHTHSLIRLSFYFAKYFSTTYYTYLLHPFHSAEILCFNSRPCSSLLCAVDLKYLKFVTLVKESKL